MLEIDLVGASHGTPHLRLYRESMAFTSLELLSKSYTKILKNKKVRAENVLGGNFEVPPPIYAGVRTGALRTSDHLRIIVS